MVKGAKALLLGLTFKENVRDHRNSKAKDLIKSLKKQGVKVIAHEPMLHDNEVKDAFKVKNMKLKDVKAVDAVVLVTPHAVFKKIKLAQIKKVMKTPLLVDVRNFFNRKQAEKLGFNYKSL